MKIEQRLVNYIITESDLLTPKEMGGRFTTEQRQFILDEMSKAAKEFTIYNAALIRHTDYKPTLVPTKAGGGDDTPEA